MTKALLGAGCFWGVEKYFQNIKGVLNTKVGYSGGETSNPTYEDVCSGQTGHAEVVLIYIDNKIISYSEILHHFWECHDPTQLNRQGFDVGTQYRSVIYFFDDEQKNTAHNSLNNTKKNFSKPIVTEINLAKEFYIAEDYHQCYIKKQQNI